MFIPVAFGRGLFEPFVPSLRLALQREGYYPRHAEHLIQAAVDLGLWLVDEGVPSRAIPSWRLDEFLRIRRQEGFQHCRTQVTLGTIRRHLEGLGAIAVLDQDPPGGSRVEQLIRAFAQYLRSERGLDSSSVRTYTQMAKQFAHCTFGDTGETSQLGPDSAALFVREQGKRYSVKTVGLALTAVRSFLQFLFLRGALARDLRSTLLKPRSWRQASLPKAIDRRAVHALFDSCDRRTHLGRRDYSMLLLLGRLGLRCREVVALDLEHVDWRRGEILIHGKGHRLDHMPLPRDVGEALAAYLRHSRPNSKERALFLQHRGPHRRLAKVAPTHCVRRACDRAGLARLGAHTLRHSTATEMLRQGASLPEVAEVLRHRSIDTTAIYAKVDQASLRQMAEPWRGGIA